MSLRAFGGAPLLGGKVVRLTYMDEAGIGKPEHEPYVVVAGVIVHGDEKLGQVRRALRKIIDKHIPAEHREGFVLTAKEIFNGGGKVFDRKSGEWPLERRLKIADDLAALPKEYNLPIAFGWVKREGFPKTWELPPETTERVRTLHELAVAFLSCSASVEQWMRNKAPGENTILIVEDNADARGALRQVHNAHQSDKYVASLESKARFFFPFKQIQEDPLFTPKKAAHPLELADFCAYLWKRYLRDKRDERFLRFIEPMRRLFVSY